MRLARHTYRLLRDLLVSGVRTGRWWVVLIVPTLWLAALALGVTKVVVPTAVYAFL